MEMEEPNQTSFTWPKKRLLALSGLIILVLILAVYWYLTSYKGVSKIQNKAQVLLPCPTIPNLCQNIFDVKSGAYYLGAGFKVHQNTKLIAAFDSQMQSKIATISGSLTDFKKTQTISIITLSDKTNKIRSDYYFPGKAASSKMVKRGEIIATASGEIMPIYQDASLAFVYTIKNIGFGPKLDGERIHLTTDSFIK